VIKVYEVIETTTRVYIITEYLSGGQLFERLAKCNKITEKVAAKYLFDLMLGMNHCHQHGVVHRDIKPENLLFESDAPDAHVKMIDFGISTLVKTAPGDLKLPVGAVLYMAPERFSGISSEKSDIWTAGVILYIILSGKIPFQGKTDAEAKRKIIEKHISMIGKAWENISEEAKNLLNKMMTKDPTSRPTAEEILSDPWMFDYTKNRIKNVPFTPEVTNSLAKFYVSPI
jgi:calcium-dependent protein kinase